jgi:hypothetical protein
MLIPLIPCTVSLKQNAFLFLCLQRRYHFESGPSLYSGMCAKGKEANPLGHVLQVSHVCMTTEVCGLWGARVPHKCFQ